MNKYKRILIKLSGEVLRGEKEYGIDPQTINSIAQQIKNVHSLDIEVAVVVGGGNIYRGVAASAAGMERTTADYMGMLATVINSLSLQDALEKIGLYVRVQSAINMPQVAEPYIQRRATRHLEKGRIVVFAAGTGNPYFTTDTAAALRAKEVNADVLLKATKVDHIFDSDPAINKEAKPIEKISHMDVIRKKLKIMDSTALSLCMDNNLPIIVFNINQADNLIKIVKGEKVGTTVA